MQIDTPCFISRSSPKTKFLKGEIMGIETFERAVEDALGEPIESIRNKTIDDRRCEIERKRKKRLRFISYFPFVGRGNVLRKFIVDHKRVEKAFRSAINRVK